MLFIQDQQGEYLPAPQETVFSEAKRLSARHLERGEPIHSARDAKEAIRFRLHAHDSEVFAVLFLDAKFRILAYRQLFRGTVNKATVYPRVVVQVALGLNAAAVILAHNHPSGDTTPSSDDIALTRKIRDVLGVIDVQVLDHLVVGSEIFSMADAGQLEL